MDDKERLEARQLEHARLMAEAMMSYDSSHLEMDEICDVQVVSDMAQIRVDQFLALPQDKPMTTLVAMWLEAFYVGERYAKLRDK